MNEPTTVSAEEYQASFSFDLQVADLFTPRSQQAQDRVLGVSDLGRCREQARLTLSGHPHTDAPDKLPAIIGNWVDAGVKTARATARPDLIHDATLTLTLPSGYQLTGHPDEIDPTEPSVTDVKTVNGLSAVRRTGPDEQQQFQRHGYYLAALQAGLIASDEGVVRNVWLDRSGKDKGCHVEQQPFDPAVVERADEWLSNVLYAVEHSEPASRDKPLPWCRACCLAGETEIVTADGIRRIADVADTWQRLLVPSSQVNGLTWHAEWRECEVRSFGVQPLRRVTLRRGRGLKVVHATPEHRWITAAPDSKIRTTDELSPGTALRKVRRNNTLNLVEIPVAVAQGFVYGDGWAHRGDCKVSIYDAGPKLKAIASYLNGEWVRLARAGWEVRHLPSRWKEAPDFRESRSFLLSWLAGYFAADGSVTKRGQATLCSAKRESLDLARYVCAAVGVGYGLIRTKSRIGLGQDEASDLHSLTIRVRDLPDWFFIQEHHRDNAAVGLAMTARDDDWRAVSVERTDRVEEVFCAVVPGIEAFALADEVLTMNCPFFSACRGSETLEGEPITGRTAELLALYHGATEQEKAGKALKAAVRGDIDGLNGASTTHVVRTTTVNAPSGPYTRVEVVPRRVEVG